MKKIKVTVFTHTSSEHGLHIGDVHPVEPDDGTKPDDSVAVVKLDQSALLAKCLDEVRASLGDAVRIHVIDYGDTSSVQVGLDTLNLALESAGANTIESDERLAMFVNSSAPLILVGDKIAFTGSIPPSFQIISRVKAALR